MDRIKKLDNLIAQVDAKINQLNEQKELNESKNKDEK